MRNPGKMREDLKNITNEKIADILDFTTISNIFGFWEKINYSNYANTHPEDTTQRLYFWAIEVLNWVGEKHGVE
jgi:hypothetical protein